MELLQLLHHVLLEPIYQEDNVYLVMTQQMLMDVQQVMPQKLLDVIKDTS